MVFQVEANKHPIATLLKWNGSFWTLSDSLVFFLPQNLNVITINDIIKRSSCNSKKQGLEIIHHPVVQSAPVSIFKFNSVQQIHVLAEKAENKLQYIILTLLGQHLFSLLGLLVTLVRCVLLPGNSTAFLLWGKELDEITALMWHTKQTKKTERSVVCARHCRAPFSRLCVTGVQ